MWERHLGQTPIADVAVTDTGVVACAGSGQVQVWRFAHDGTPLQQDDLGVGYHPRTDGRTVVYHDGERFHAAILGDGEQGPIPGVPVGNNATGLSPAGIAFYQRATGEGFNLGVYCGSVRVADYRPTGIWESHDDGTVAMMDDCNRPAYAPGAGGYVHRCDDLMVGEGPQGGVQVWFEGVRHLLDGGTDTKWPRVSVRDGLVAIVSWGDAGTRLWVGTLADVRTLPLEIPAAPAHLVGCGYFFRDSQQYGDHPAAPGTHSVIVDEPRALPAEPRPDGTHVRMILGLPCLLHEHLARWWDQVDAVYVAAEGHEAQLEQDAGVARWLMQARGLAPKPIVSYTGAAVFPEALEADDLLGVQLYLEPGETPEALRARAQAIWPQVAHRRLVIIGQAYDRGGAFTGEVIAALQPVLYDLACAWPTCEALLWFSDGRPGGVRDYEAEVRPWHNAIAEAIGRR